MNTDEHGLTDVDDNQLTETIIGCAYTVSNTLGIGFLEKVYENALRHEISKNNLFIEQQKPLRVIYDGIVVGDYRADLLVERRVLVELKVVNALNDIHLAQCLNYLKASDLRIALLVNFARPRVEVKRIRND